MWRDLGLHEPRTWVAALAALAFLVVVGAAFVAGAVAVGLDVPVGEVAP